MARAVTDDPKVVTASRLTDGVVVWLDANHTWVEEIARAHPLPDADTLAQALAAAQASAARQEVVEPYAVDIAQGPGTPRPLKMRERVRAGGPTITAPDAVLLNPDAPIREVV